MNFIVYAGDHSNARTMACLLIVSGLLMVALLVVKLIKNKKKK